MSAALSGRDASHVGDVLETVLRPHEHEALDGWRRAVLERIKRLVSADLGGFLIGTRTDHDWLSDYPSARVADYGVRIEELAPDVDDWGRHAALGVHTRDEVWLPIRGDFYETRYYQDFLRPLRALDAMGVTWHRDGAPGPDGVCQLLVHHESERGPRFGAREKAMLELLRPALAAGTRNALATGGGIDATIDRIDAAVALLDGAGRVVHLNPAARSILRAHPELEEALSTAARERVAGLATAPSRPPALTGRVGEGGRAIGFTLTRLPGPGPDRSGHVMTLQAAGGRRGASTAAREVAHRLGLTPRQVEVALLLARGLSNKAVARELGIRPKTARRHTEDVLARLGLSRRAQVAAALLQKGVGLDA